MILYYKEELTLLPLVNKAKQQHDRDICHPEESGVDPSTQTIVLYLFQQSRN
jgi:hypothetical protein